MFRPERSNPFPGLRPFRSDEHHLFFGREEQTAALLQLLRTNRFLAVVGTSGSGKSSLVRAGMIAELYGGTMTHAGSRWEVMILRPGGSPVENLARAMLDADLYDPEDPNTLPRLRATLNRSRFGLVEATKQSEVFEPGTNLLVVVDQFEELFRFRQQGVDSEEAAAAFVNLLLTASEQTECPIYVTITMRSDYLGDCSEIPGLAEAVNEGEYLIPRLLRDQKRDAIEKPVGVGGGKISPLLVQRLLNDVGDDPDQLPVLQHALMRMWEVWQIDGDPSRPIDVRDFEAIGGLEAALSNHADEIYDSLPDDEHRRVCERVFKTLTEKGSDNRGIRRPTRLKRLEVIAATDRATIIEVLDAFRQPGVTFLMPGLEQDLDDQTVLDLSHESLMRVWRRLRGWVEEEAQSARIFRRLLDTAWLWREQKAGLFRDPDLQIALSWRQEEHPNSEWAEQYGGQYDVAIRFLESSEREAKAEIEAHEIARRRELEQARQLAEARQERLQQQQRAAQKLRKVLAGLAIVAVIAVSACFLALAANREANRLAVLARLAAEDAKQNAAQAEQNARESEESRKKAEASEREAQLAEQRSREFRYATDMQLAAILAADRTANASQVFARLADHAPDADAGSNDSDDLRGFEWHYIKQQVEARATVFAGFSKEVVEATLNAAGELVTLDSDARLQHWDPKTQRESRTARDLQDGRSPGATALSPDGSRVAVLAGNEVRLYDAATGTDIGEPLPVAPRSLLFSPDSQMLVTVDTGLGWWDAATGRPIARDELQLQLRSSNVSHSLSADGLTLVVGWQGTYGSDFAVFRMNPEDRVITRLSASNEQGSTKRALTLSPDGGTVAVSYYFQGSVSLSAADTARRTSRFEGIHAAAISALAFSSDGARLLTGALDGSIRVWDNLKNFDADSSIPLLGHTEEVRHAAFVAGGRQVLSIGRDKTVRLWNLEQSSTSLHQALDQGAYRAQYSPDGALLALSDVFSGIELRDGFSGTVVARWPRDNADGLSADSVAFSPDGRLFAAGFGGKTDLSYVELWDIARHERLAVLPGSTALPGYTTNESTGTVPALTFSPDGRFLVAGFGSLNLMSYGDQGDFPLLVYDVAARRIVRRLEGPRNFTVAAAFSPDGRRLANACYDGTARIWDTSEWKILQVLHNPDATSDAGNRRVQDVTFSPDGARIATASAEGNVHIWDGQTGDLLQTLRGHSNAVWGVSFSPDGRTLASGSADGTIRLWHAATWRELVRLAPEIPMAPMALRFSPDGSRLLATNRNGPVLVWSVRATDAAPRPQTLAALLSAPREFASQVQLRAGNPLLGEVLSRLPGGAEHPLVASALTALRADASAAQRNWPRAVEQLDQLERLPPPRAWDWLASLGQLHLATALTHQGRPADAARLLAAGESSRQFDGSRTVAAALGIVFSALEFPLTLTSVTRGSPAWRAGLRAGDRILKFNDTELTSQTYSQYAEVVRRDAPFTLTVQSPNAETTRTVTVTRGTFFRDERVNDAVDELAATVADGLEKSPGHPGLLELRAELAGLSEAHNEQVADYSTLIEALEQQEPIPVADLERLRRRRGSAYVALKQWREALDDFSAGHVDGVDDEALLARQALAQAELLWAENSAALEEVWFDDDPPPGAILKGDTPWEFVSQPEHPVYSGAKASRRQAQAKSQHLFEYASVGLPVAAGDTLFAYVFLDPADPPRTVMLQVNDGGWIARAFWGEDLIDWGTAGTASRQLMGPLPAVGKWVRLEVPVEKIELKPGTVLKGLAFTQYGGTCYWDRAGKLTPKPSDVSPWQLMAAVYRALGDQSAIDQLIQRRPQAAKAIGDLFTERPNPDWRRAVEIYSRGITPETSDGEWFAHRARACEALGDWPAAAADWQRAAALNPDIASQLREFADRLQEAGYGELAVDHRQRARGLLETALRNDPGDMSALEALSAMLLDSAIQQSWTAMTLAEQKTVRGVPVEQQPDQSLVVNDLAERSVALAAGDDLQAVRIETAAAATAARGNAVTFKDYQIVSTSLPAEGFRGRYVRLDLPGDNDQVGRAPNENGQRMINLAELQVLRGKTNVALSKSASQSSTYHDSFGDWTAERAVDGKTEATPEARSMAHTTPSRDGNNPWWEVDLGEAQPFDAIVVWNRPSHLNRMKHFRICVLDADRRVVFEQVVDQPPNPSTTIRRTVQVARAAGEAGAWHLRFNDWSEVQRMRVSVTNSRAVLVGPAAAGPEESASLVWTSEPLTAAGKVALVPYEDGSVGLKLLPDFLPLPQLEQTTQAVRVEFASVSESAATAPTTFNDYRVESLTAPRSETGALRGRYVRLDLPGSNRQHPRQASDGPLKIINFAELQVFQGTENIALDRPARQSSNYSTNAKYAAKNAVDGNTQGTDSGHPYAHTIYGAGDPWWEVDLGSEQPIDRMVIWNRSDFGGERLNHFRVRVLDEARRVVLEQVVDRAPAPSHEIACHSLLLAASPAAEGQPPQWSLRLGETVQLAPGGRFRISATDAFGPLKREEAVVESRALASPLARLAAGYGYHDASQESAKWFRRARAAATTVKASESVLRELQQHPPALAELLRQTPDDVDLQLTQFRSFVSEGQRLLAEKKSAPALAQFQQAEALVSRFLQAFPEPAWTILRPAELKSEGGATLTLQADGSILVSGTNPDEDTYSLTAPAPLKRIAAFRLEALPDPSLPSNGPGRVGNFHMSEFRAAVGRAPIRFVNVAVDHDEIDQSRLLINGRIDPAFGWSIEPERGQPHTAVMAAEAVVPVEEDLLTFELAFSRGEYKKHGLGRFRISVTDDSGAWATAATRLKLSEMELTALDTGLGRAYAGDDQPAEAAAAFARALDRMPLEEDRKRLIDSLEDQSATLTLLVEQRPRDRYLQLALARGLAKHGKQALTAQRLDEALSQLTRASGLFSRLAAEYPDSEWVVLNVVDVTSDGGAEFSVLPDGSILASGNNRGQMTYTVVTDAPVEGLSALRLESIPDPSLPKNGAGRDANGSFVVREIAVSQAEFRKPDTANVSPLPLVDAIASFNRPNSSSEAKNAIDGDIQTVWDPWPEVYSRQQAVFAARVLDETQRRPHLVVKLTTGYQGGAPSTTLGCFRLSVTSDPRALEVSRFHQELKASGLMELALSLANAQAQQGKPEEAATAYGQAFDLASSHEARGRILREVSAHPRAFEVLQTQKADGAVFHVELARHQQSQGALSAAETAARRARELYERQLAADPHNGRLGRELADLLLETGAVASRLLTPVEMSSAGGATFHLQDDGSIFVDGSNVDGDVYTLVANTGVRVVHALRLEVLPDDRLPKNGPGRHSTGNFQLTGLRLLGPPRVGEDSPAPVAFRDVVASFAYQATDADVKATIDERNSANKVWHVWGHQGEWNYADYALAEPLRLEPGDRLTVVLKHKKYGSVPINLGRFRLSVSDDPQGFDRRQTELTAKSLDNPWLRLASAYRGVGAVEQALEACVHAVELAASPRAKTDVARQAAAFEDLFPKLLERIPDAKPLRLGRAKYLGRNAATQEQFRYALEALNEFAADVPDDLDLLTMRAEVYEKLGRWSEAETDYARIMALESDAGRRRDTARKRAEMQIQSGRYEAAAESYFQQMLLDPRSIDRPREAVISQLLAGNARRAQIATRRLYELTHSNMTGGYPWGRVQVVTAQPGFVTQGNLTNLLAAAKAAGPPNTERMTAALYYRLGDLQRAQSLLSTANDDPLYEALAAMLLFDLDRVDEARGRLQRAAAGLERVRGGVDHDVATTVNWQDWGPALVIWREAARKLIGPRIVALDDEVYGGRTLEILHAAYGTAVAQRDVTEILQKRFSASGTLSWPSLSYNQEFGGDPAPNTVKTLTVKYRLNGHDGQRAFPENASIEFPFPPDMRPSNTAALRERASLLVDAGLNEEALRDLERLAELEADEPALHARVLAALHRDAEALPLLSRAIEAGSGDEGLYAARGAILLRQGQTDQARADLERALQLKPAALAARAMSDLLLDEAQRATAWSTLKPTEMKSAGGAALALRTDGAILASGVNPERDTYTVTVRSDLPQVTAIRLEALLDPSLPNHGPGRNQGNGNFALNELQILAQNERIPLTAVVVQYDEHGESHKLIDGAIDGFAGWANAGNDGQGNVAVMSATFAVPADSGLRFELHFPSTANHALGCFRLSVTDDPAAFVRERRRLEALRLTTPWPRLAAAYEVVGRAEDLDALVGQHPEVAADIGQGFIECGNWERAISFLNRVLTPETTDVDLLVARATAQAHLARWDEAAADWDRVFQLRTNDVPLATACAALYESLGEKRRAAAAFGRLIDWRLEQAVPGDELVQVYRLRGALYVRTGEWALAAADYAESVFRNPDADSIAWMAPAALWAYAGDAEQHRRYCQRMAEKFRDSSSAPDVERLLKVSALIAANPPIDRVAAARFDRIMASEDSPGLRGWFLTTQALLRCRNQDLDGAQQPISESLKIVGPDGTTPSSFALCMTLATQTLLRVLRGEATGTKAAVDDLQHRLSQVGGLKWTEDGRIDGRTLLSGETVQHDLLIPEIIRREAASRSAAGSRQQPLP